MGEINLNPLSPAAAEAAERLPNPQTDVIKTIQPVLQSQEFQRLAPDRQKAVLMEFFKQNNLFRGKEEIAADGILRPPPVTPQPTPSRLFQSTVESLPTRQLGVRLTPIERATGAATVTGAGTALGGVTGGAMTGGNPLGIATGAAIGDILGTAVSMALGFEEPDEAQFLFSTLPFVTGAMGGVARSSIRATEGGTFLTTIRQGQLVERIPDLIFNNPSRSVLRGAFNQMAGQGLTIPGIESVRFAVQRMQPVIRNRVLARVRNLDPTLADTFDDMLGTAQTVQRRPPGTRFDPQPTQDITPPLNELAVEDVHSLRSRLLRLERAFALELETRAGIASPLDFQAVREIRRTIDRAIDAAENLPGLAGEGARQLRGANLLSRQLDAAESMRDAIQTTMKSRRGDLVIDMDTLRDRLRTNPAFESFNETLDMVPGAREAFEQEMNQISSMTRGRLFTIPRGLQRGSVGFAAGLLAQRSGFGLLGQTAAFGAGLALPDILAQILTTRRTRRLMMRMLRLTDGGISIPMLATVLAAARGGFAALGSEAPQAAQNVINFPRNILAGEGGSQEVGSVNVPPGLLSTR